MRRNWIKLYVDQCLRGSMMNELDPAERFVWFGFLLLAGDNPLDGKICISEDMGYTDEQISAMLKVELGILRSAKRKMVKHEKIRVLDNNVIEIINWEKYQSEYQRQRNYRDEYERKLQRKVTSESNNGKLLIDRDRDRDKERDKEEEKNNGRSGPLSEPETNTKFEEFWFAYPKVGRHAKKESRVKFGALVKRGELLDFVKGFHGYLDFLKHQKVKNQFDQRPMYAKTFLGERWKEFIDFKFEAPL